jgi:Sulfotransferase family/Domain of unknown function (DUF6473)
MTRGMAPDPIVVYGAPRSGTTYLEQILNAHPDVFISHETRVFAWLHRVLEVLPQDDRLVSNERDAFTSHLRAVFPELIRDFYRDLAPDAVYWGDKNPHYAARYHAGCLEMIAGMFPRSRFIHIIRDGRDVVSSILRKHYAGGKPWVKSFEQAHTVWTSHVERGTAFGRTLAEGRYFELRYEDLVADDVALSAQMFNFLGLELNPAVEAFCRGQRENRIPFKEPTRDFGRGIAASDWERIFSPDEQRRSLELIGPHLIRHGYETEEWLAQVREEASDRPSAPMGYQERDHEIVDYEMFLLPGTGRRLRGPAPKRITPGEYFTCLGAAQTFGCFCEKPYPALLSDRLNLPVLNLGLAGVGPRFFLQPRGAPLLEYVNEGKFAVVQVMSGRSEDNSLFESGGREYLTRRSNGQRIAATLAYGELLAQDVEKLKSIAEETRANWIESFSTLLQAIEVPTILFWFSKRSPDYEEGYSDLRAFFGEFPQLVNSTMMECIRPLSDEYAQCISARGSPQRLISRFTGEPVAAFAYMSAEGPVEEEFNTYYPSPEMHEDAAEALLEACRKYAARPP